MLTTPVTQSQFPIAETMKRLSALDKDFRADTGVLEAGWFAASALLDDEARQLERGLSIAHERYPGADRRAQGAFFLGDYAWYLTNAVVAAYLAERRVPSFGLDDVAIRYSTYTWEYEGRTGEASCLDVRFLTGRFATLPNDSEANHPDAIVLADAEALRDWMHGELEAHLNPVIDQILAHTRLGRRPQWNLAADACARVFLHYGKLLGNAALGMEEGRTFIKLTSSPMRTSTTDYLTLEAHGHSESYCARGGCCRYYTVPSANGHKCSTCVLRPLEERRQILQDYLNQRYAPAE